MDWKLKIDLKKLSREETNVWGNASLLFFFRPLKYDDSHAFQDGYFVLPGQRIVSHDRTTSIGCEFANPIANPLWGWSEETAGTSDYSIEAGAIIRDW